MNTLRTSRLFCFLSMAAASLPSFAAGKSDFLSLCKDIAEEQGAASGFCGEVATKFFGGAKAKNAATIIQPVDVGAPQMSVDSKVQYIVFNDPNYLAGMAYCYFAYRGWIDSEKFSPDDVVLASSGFSILKESLSEYKKWLSSNAAGIKCRTRVEKESGVPVTDLESALREYAAIIGINPLASVKSGKFSSQEIHDEMKLTVNHERVHAYQVLCPSLEEWGQKKWKELPAEEQAKFPKVYPSYNWNDLKIAGREYVAYSFENKPLKISDHLGKCKIR